MATKILFVCTQNQWRSLTAEHIFKNRSGWSVRSAGTAASARVQVRRADVEWADLIFVMEKKHQEILQQRFPDIMRGKKTICLDIPDEYEYMDEELVRILEESMLFFCPTVPG
jgi:predicted protein tyrosine phosphatase